MTSSITTLEIRERKEEVSEEVGERRGDTTLFSDEPSLSLL